MYEDLGFANRERLGNGRPSPGRSSRAERGTPRSYVKPRSRAARRVHLFSPELMRAPDARGSHMSVRAARQKRCVKRELRCAHSRHSHAHSRDRRCQLAFSDNFHPSKGARSRLLALLLFYLSLFLSACTFTIVRSTIASRWLGVNDRGREGIDGDDPCVAVLVSRARP